MTGINYRDTTYLLDGRVQQRRAFHALHWLNVFDLLRAYDPVLVGTMPLNIDIPGSDLDIICEVHDADALAQRVRHAYGKYVGFRLHNRTVNDLPTTIAQFTYRKFLVEIFGQPRPVEQQHAYRHMLVEARLLALGGDNARRAIRDLKRDGLKTEPAFVQHFKLDGDPYQTLLDLAALDDDALRAAIAGA